MNLRIISSSDIRQLISMADAIEIMKHAFAQLSSGRAQAPVRTQVEVARHEGTALFMPAYLEESDRLGCKIVSVFPSNLTLGIPTIHALVAVVDARTGQPSAVMDGTFLTALRTGAASGAATDLLARRDTRVVAIIGTGVQGRTALEAVCEVRSVEEVRVFDTDADAASTYVEEMRGRGGRIPPQIQVAPSVSRAVQEADVICTTTTSPKPVFEDHDIANGTHINAVGCFTPDTHEIPTATIQRARLFVDSREACWAEAGDLIIPRSQGLITDSDIMAELGELVRGEKQGRTGDEEITLFESVGNAVQDVAVAARVLEEAANQGLGTVVEL